jgi:chorismate mutase
MFKGRVYVLCPEPETPADPLLMLIDMVEDLQAVPLTLEPDEHDRIMATVSHAPQLLAIALVHAAMEEDNLHRLLDVTVGPGFLDLTRIAASSFEQWKGVLELNREAILAALDRFERSLTSVRQALTEGELAELWDTVSRARRRMTPEVSSRKRTPELRVLIDQHDERILKALSDRLSTVKQVGALKRQRSEAVYDPDRERRLFSVRREWGRALGLPADLVDELFDVIVRLSRAIQE